MSFISKIVSTISYLFWTILLPELVRNGIIYIIIYIKFGAKKSLLGSSSINFSWIIHEDILLSKWVLVGPSVIMNGSIQVGRHTYIWAYSEILSTKKNPIIIGSFCSIASNFFAISYNLHDYTCLSTSTSFGPTISYEDTGSPIVIWNDVWIGNRVTVLPWVTVGHGAVIGAWSIVTKDIPPYAIVAGNPARILRYRFDEITIKELLHDEWWKQDMSIIEERYKDFNSQNNKKL